MIAIWIALGVVALILLFVGTLYVIGSRLPVKHTAGAVLDLAQPVERVFDLLADIERQPQWDKKVTGVERLPDENGQPRHRFRMGRNSFVLVTTVSDRPRTLQRTIIDDAKFFGGSWTYEFTPTANGCRVALTERGEIYSAIPRAMMSYLVSPHTYLVGQLKTVAAHFGQAPRITLTPYSVG